MEKISAYKRFFFAFLWIVYFSNDSSSYSGETGNNSTQHNTIQVSQKYKNNVSLFVAIVSLSANAKLFFNLSISKVSVVGDTLLRFMITFFNWSRFIQFLVFACKRNLYICKLLVSFSDLNTRNTIFVWAIFGVLVFMFYYMPRRSHTSIK